MSDPARASLRPTRSRHVSSLLATQRSMPVAWRALSDVAFPALREDNLANSRGIVGGQSVYEVGNPSGLAEVITQPRTLGLSASRRF